MAKYNKNLFLFIFLWEVVGIFFGLFFDEILSKNNHYVKNQRMNDIFLKSLPFWGLCSITLESTITNVFS
jgi:hypothetical protein